MSRLISLTLSLIVCFSSAINRGDAAPIINNTDEATLYLSRFGYLDPGYQRSPSYSSSLSAKSFSDVIKDFQSFVGLKKTGKLDKETLKSMNKPRCGVPDRVRPGSSTRQKRFVREGSRWPKKQLTYKIKKYSAKMNKSDVDREIAKAFQMWADVANLTFVHLDDSDKVDIEILFLSGEHPGGCTPFKDGADGVLAHAFFPRYGGNAHFDESEKWTLNSDNGTNLFQLATHEFGHSLGLYHPNVTTAVMHSLYEYRSDFKLDKDDIEGIQELYGANPLWKLTMEFKAMKKEWIEVKNQLEAERKDNLKRELRAKMESRLELGVMKMELRETESTVADLTNTLNARTSEIVDIGKMPSSCADLRRMGQKISGFFSVKGTNKMEMIYCDFYHNQNDKQKWIGYADVKSAPVHFYVQRRTSFSAVNTPIPFELTRVNDGNAMNLTSGIFKAPRPGIYFFSFTGLVHYLKASSSRVGLGLGLFLNGARIGEGYVATEKFPTYQFCPVTLQSTLTLKKGDQIIVQITDIYPGVQLYDDNWQRTHFTGFMLEEEIVASL